MKNIVTCLFASILPFLFVAGCSESEETTTQEPLRFWHFWSEPRHKAQLDSLIGIFEKENSCTVETTELSWNDGKTKLFAAFNAGGEPDVLELGSDWIAQFSSEGVLQPLDKPAGMPAYALQAAEYNGTLYAMPWVLDTRVLFYNKSLLEKAGIAADTITTFASLEAACRKLHNPSAGVYAWGANGPDAHRLYKKILPFFWSFGGDILSSDGKPTFNKPENIAALEQYARLSSVGLIETQRQLDEAFTQGKIAFWLSGSWLTEKLASSSAPIQYGVVPMPSGIVGKSGLSFAGGEYVAITEKSKHPLAKKFIQFITTNAAAGNFANAISMFPADSTLRNTLPTTDAIRSAFAQQLQAAKMTPSHPQWLDIEQLLETAAEEALYSKKTAKEALEYAQQQAQNTLKK